MQLKFYLKNYVKNWLNIILRYSLPVLLLNSGFSFATVPINKSADPKVLAFSKNSSKTNKTKYIAFVTTVNSFFPTTAGTGTTVTIVGSGFSGTTGAAAVKFGGTNAQSYTVISNNVISAVVASGTSGAVTVTNAGTGSLAGFTYVTAPIISYPVGQVFTVGTSISNISPTNSGGAVPATSYGLVSTFAGSGTTGVTDGVGTAASFSLPYGIGHDAAGNLYLTNANTISNTPPNNLIRKIAPDATVTTFAGTGPAGNSNGTTTTASFNKPISLALDPIGNIYVGELNNVLIRKIATDGTVSTLAGAGYGGNTNGTGTAATFNSPASLATDVSGNIYVADNNNNLIRKITPAGVVTTLAGSGSAGSGNGTGTGASFSDPEGVAVDASGNIYVADGGNNLIRKITTGGVVTTFAGTGAQGNTDGDATTASFHYPICLAFDPLGNLYVGDYFNSRIRKITPAGIVSTLAGNGTYGTNNGLGSAATFDVPVGLTVDGKGNLFVTENISTLVRKIVLTGYSISPALPAGLSFDPTTGTISGNPTASSVATSYTITAYNLAGSSTANITLAVNVPAPVISYTSPQNYRLNKPISTLSPSNTGGSVPANSYSQVSTFAGNSRGYVDGTGTGASFFNPIGVATDLAGNIYVVDNGNNRIRKITPAGVVTTFAGSGIAGFADGTGTAASFNNPWGIATDAAGNVYVADQGNNRIRKITPGGVVTTLAGSTYGYADGTGTAAKFSFPVGVATDASGNVYVADELSHRIRKITPSGVVTTLAGSGTAGFADGTGAAASFNNPYGVATDATGNVYVADDSNNRIRKITPSGVVTTLAGSGTPGFADGTGTAASFNDPVGVSLDAAGNVYVADYTNNRIRKITPTGVVTTLAGNNSGEPYDGIGTGASFSNPYSVAADASGNLYVSDFNNNRIRKILITGYAISPALPTGLSFDTSTGNITGTPTVIKAATDYTISANNLGGSSSFILNLAVNNNFIWTGGGGDNNWNTGKNWNTGTVPTDGSIVIFNNNKSNTVTIPSGTNVNLSSIIVGGSTGTSTNLIEGNSNNTFIANYTRIISKSALQFTSGILTLSGIYSTGNFTLNGSIAQLDTLVIDSGATGTLTNSSNITLATYLLVQTNCILNVNESSQITMSYDNNYNIAYIENDGTINSSASTFNFSYNISESSSLANQIDNYGTFNDNGSTFNLDGTNSQILNESWSKFICIGSSFNCGGGVNYYYGIYSLHSIENNGFFFALGSTKIFLSGYSSNLLNATNGSGNTAYFILGPKSRTEATGTNSEVLSVNQNIGESSYRKGYFILNSDKDNSAYVYESSESNGFSGQFKVQRYFTGNNSSNYRGYRLVSSPVNSTSPYPATSYDAQNYIDYSYLNQTFSYPSYKGYGFDTTGVTSNGLATGGSGTGFTFHNNNPLLYLYNETYDPSNELTSFTASKYAGITSIYPATIYNELHNNPSVDRITTSKGASVTADNAQIPVGNGLGVYYVGSNTRTSLSASVPPDSAIATFYGYINQGDIDVYPWFAPTSNKLSYTTSALNPNVFYPGTNLVGNPYPATIDLRLVHNDNPTFTSFAELNDVAPHGYVIYGWDGEIETKSSSAASRYIASGQGFFVTAIDANQTLTFHESQKVYDTTLLTSSSKPPGLLAVTGGSNIFQNNNSLKVISNSQGIDVSSIHIMLKQDSLNTRETGIYFNKKWDDKFGKGDALDFDGLGLKIFLSSYTADGARVGINGMGDYVTGKKIKLYVKATTDGTYSLQLSDIANIDQSLMNVYLIDNNKKDSVDLVAGKGYSFSIVNADTTTYGPNRFILSLQRKPYQLLAFNAAKTKSTITLNWQTKNEGDFTGFGIQKLNLANNNYLTIDTLQSNGTGSYTINDPSASTGENTYRLAQNNINGAVSYSTPVTIKYGLLSTPNALGIFPNPVVDNVLFDFSGLITKPSGSYTVSIYNTLGVLISENNSTINFLNINLSTLKPGIYIVHIKTNNGNILGKSTFIKN